MADINISKYTTQVLRVGSTPSSPGFAVDEGQDPVDPSGNPQTHLPVTIAAAANALSITESQVLSGAGTVAQYVRGDGSLADFPESSGGGSSVSYYLNGSVSQGTIGGVAYLEMNKVPILGVGTDFTIAANGYIASFITDAGDPNLLEIPGGNWNFESYFSASSGGGSPTFYVELYKVNAGGTATLIASNSANPELISFGTTIAPYFSSLAVPTTVLALTDRLAVRYYVTHSGRTITLHTEGPHLCQIITTFTTGLTSLNGLNAQVQFFAVGTSGTDFNIASATATHTFNLPTASSTNRGALSSADWALFTQAYNDKINSASVTGTTTKTLTLTQQDGGTITASWTDLNTDAVLSVFGRTGAVVAVSGDYTTAQVTESGNLYYTDGRARGALSFAAGSGAYNTSTGVITIPTNNNQITNGAGYITSAALGGYVQGSGSAGQVAYWSSGSAITGESNLFWDASNDRLGIGNATPNEKLEVNGAISATGTATTTFASSATMDYFSGSTRFISRGGNNSTRGAYRFLSEAADGGLSIDVFQIQTNGIANFYSSITATSIIRSGGTSSQYLMADGSVSTLSNPVTGSGSPNAIPKFTGSTTIGNSQITDDGTTVTASGNIYVGNTFRLTKASSVDIQAYTGSAYSNLFYDAASHNWQTSGGTAKMVLVANGNLLVGTTTDAGFKLDVNGTGRFKIDGLSKFGLDILNNAGSRGAGFYNTGGNNVQLYFYNSAGTEKIFLDGGTGAATFSSSITSNSGDFFATDGTRTNFFGVGTGANVGYLGTTTNHSLAFLTNNTEKMRITAAGDLSFKGRSTTANYDAVFYNDNSQLAINANNTNVGKTINFNVRNDQNAMTIASGGSVTINNLSGSGNRIVVANSGGTLISAVIGSGLAFDGTTLTATGGSSGSISGSGTSGTIALFTGTSSIGNSVITQTSSTIGINNSGTGAMLTVKANSTTIPQLRLEQDNVTDGWGFLANRSTGYLNIDRYGGASTTNAFSIVLTSGNVLLGTASDNGNRLRVNGTIFSDSSVTATSFFESSDATLKTLVEDDYQAKGIDSVVAKLYIKNGKQELGYYAQDLEGILPSAVNKGTDGLLNLSYREVHTAKLQFLEQKIKELEAQLKNN